VKIRTTEPYHIDIIGLIISPNLGEFSDLDGIFNYAASAALIFVFVIFEKFCVRLILFPIFDIDYRNLQFAPLMFLMWKPRRAGKNTQGSTEFRNL
jgi:hypothetical protein